MKSAHPQAVIATPASSGLTRREFVAGAVTAAGVMAGGPALLRGRNLNDKLNIAFIACGGRALANLNELTLTPGAPPAPGRSGNAPAAPHPDENVVVLCDVNQDAVDAAAQRFPQARKFNDLRRAFAWSSVLS